MHTIKTDTPVRKTENRKGQTIFVPKHVHTLSVLGDVDKVKSVWRAMRRGRMSTSGKLYPDRPFNNRKRTKGRKIQKDFERVSLEIKIRRALKKAQLLDKNVN